MFEDEENDEEENIREDNLLQLEFPIEHYFLLGSPLGIFVSVYNEEDFIRE